MLRSRKIQLISFILCFLFFTDSGAAAPRWKYLGSRQVNKLIDHDTIPVTFLRGAFRKIRIRVSRTDINFHRVVVHYGSGDDETVEIRKRIPAGGYTRAIDLRGHDRVIRSVEFWYDSRGIFGRRGVVTLYGLQ